MNYQKKIEKLYFIYRHIMFQEAFEILQDKALSEDAVSETFVRLFHHLDKVDEATPHRTCNFLKTICRNVAIDFYRKNKRESTLLHSTSVTLCPPLSPEEIVLDRESTDRVAYIISQMDSKYKDVLILSRIYHLKNEDIALLFGISSDAVAKRLQRAKAEIKNKLAKEDV